ncbi:putative ribonuclease H-like domain-containing protein [Tanacetum coccineum]
MTQKLRNGFEFIKKAFFMCGSFNHLIKDCDFHDNKMVEKCVLNNKGRVTGQREIRLVWNDAQRVNHQTKLTHPHPKRNFIPTTVATKSGQVPVNAAKQNSLRAATSISTVGHVNTVAPKLKVKTARLNNVSTAWRKAVVSAAVRNGENSINADNLQYTLHDQGIFDSECSRHMIGNKSFLTDYQKVYGGFVAFAGSPKGGKITRKGKIRTGKLDFEDVYFVKELKFNLFFVSQMCDKKNSVLFTETECLVLSPDFKPLDESQVLLKVPRQNNMYSFDLKNIVSSGGLTCLFVKATINASNLWHRRLAHTNFKTMNKLMRENLVRGLPSKLFENDHTCAVCQKGKQHKASCKTKLVSSISQPLQMLHMDIWNPPFIVGEVISNHKIYCRRALDNLLDQTKEGYTNSTNRDSTVSTNRDRTVSLSISAAGKSFTNANDLPIDPLMPGLDYTSIFSGAYDDDDVGVEADHNNLETSMNVSPIPTTRIHKDHPEEHTMKVWRLVDLPKGKHAIGTKWVYRNKKDERGIVVRNKARLVAQDVRSAFVYGTIEEEVYVYQPPSFEDPQFPDKVYKVENTLYGLHQAPGALYETLFIKKDKGDILLVKQKDDGIFISPDKYVADILKMFDFVTMKTKSTPIETNKAFFKDEEAEDVDVHLYRSMIGSLMYLTTSRSDIMFAVCACARFQVTLKVSHLHAVKRIFRYLKGQPKLSLLYPRDSPFDLEAFSDSDYAGTSLDRKSTTRGCQFLGKRFISWQRKKQTIVANSTIEAEYVAAANCCGHVLWIQNQMLDYGFNFMNTKFYIDNESTICIVKNLMFHSKTKHLEISHHFIRDSSVKKLIQVIKIHTNHNVADLLTKAFDVSRPIHLHADETVYKEWEDRMERAATTASSLEA